MKCELHTNKCYTVLCFVNHGDEFNLKCGVNFLCNSPWATEHLFVNLFISNRVYLFKVTLSFNVSHLILSYFALDVGNNFFGECTAKWLFMYASISLIANRDQFQLSGQIEPNSIKYHVQLGFSNYFASWDEQKIPSYLIAFAQMKSSHAILCFHSAVFSSDKFESVSVFFGFK